MKIDTYTRVILTIIAAALCAIVAKPVLSPEIVAIAQSHQKTSAASIKPEPEAKEVVWEYGVMSMSRDSELNFTEFNDAGLDSGSGGGINGRLTRLASQGWELVSVSTLSNHTGTMYAGLTSEVMFVLRRPKR